jgi:hypothetical protein
MNYLLNVLFILREWHVGKKVCLPVKIWQSIYATFILPSMDIRGQVGVQAPQFLFIGIFSET